MKKRNIELLNSIEKLGFKSIKTCKCSYYLYLCLVQQWIRNEYDIHISLILGGELDPWWSCDLTKISNGTLILDCDYFFQSSEYALEAGIKEFIKLKLK